MADLLHQGELKLTRMTSVNGSTGIGDGGNALRTIGNRAIYDGSFEWTKEGAIYGNQQIVNGGMPVAYNGGVPVLSENLRGYFDKRAKYTDYGILKSSAIVNSARDIAKAPYALDCDMDADGNVLSLHSGEYMWTSGTITETDHAFHYADADGKPYNPNMNVRTHSKRNESTWHDNAMNWHTDSDSWSNTEKQFDYYDAPMTIFSGASTDEFVKSDAARIQSGGDEKKISLEDYAKAAESDLKKDKDKILEVIGKRKYEPVFTTPSFIREEHKDFWPTIKSASAINGKVFDDGSWWMLVKASAAAIIVAWCDFCETKIDFSEQSKAYPDEYSKFAGRIVEYSATVSPISKNTSKYGFAEIGLTEYRLVSSDGTNRVIYKEYTIPPYGEKYVITEEEFQYTSETYQHTSAFGVVLGKSSSSQSFMAKQHGEKQLAIFDKMPPSGDGVIDVPIGDGFRMVAGIDGTTHDVYDGSTLVTSYISFDAESNVMACKLSKDVYLVGVHGKGIFVVNASVPTEKDSGLRNYRLRYMNSTSEMKGES